MLTSISETTPCNSRTRRLYNNMNLKNMQCFLYEMNKCEKNSFSVYYYKNFNKFSNLNEIISQLIHEKPAIILY